MAKIKEENKEEPINMSNEEVKPGEAIEEKGETPSDQPGNQTDKKDKTKKDKKISVENGIKKQFGEGVIVNAQYIFDNKPVIIPISPALDIITGGIPEGSFVTFTGQPKCGKCGNIESIVFTPSGPKKLGDLQVGDEVCTPFNNYSKITEIFDLGKLPTYNVIFDNGDKYECGLDHLWEVCTRYTKANPRVMTTKQLLDTNILVKDRPKWAVITPEVNFREKPIKLDPYFLGLLIGDGGITEKAKCIGFTSTDKELIKYIDKYVFDTFEYNLVKRSVNTKIEYRIKSYNQPNKIKKILMEYGLYGCNSHTKFIPDEYKYNTKEVRLAIIQGLLDTDGTVSKNNRVSLSSTSLRLANDVKDIIQSLGGIAKVVVKYTKCNGKTFKSYGCYIRYNKTKELFRLKRKIKRTKTRTKEPLMRKIVAIKPSGKVTHCKCIKLDYDRGLYVGDDYIVTHNTTTTLHFAANAQDPKYGGTTCPEGREVYYYNIEHRIKERDIAGIPHLRRDKFHIIQSSSGKILNASDFLEIAEQLISEKPGSIHIIDSYSSLCTEAEMVGSMADQQRADGAKALAKFCRKTCGKVPVNKCIVIGITHQMGNPGAGYSPWKEKSGQAIMYQSNVKLQCLYHQPWKLSKDGPQIGQQGMWTCLNTATYVKPCQQVMSYVRYGIGIDAAKEVFHIGVDLGLIKQGGAWYTFGDEFNNQKAQGEENACEIIRNTPNGVELLYSKIRAMLGM